jgi:hypothetical protein
MLQLSKPFDILAQTFRVGGTGHQGDDVADTPVHKRPRLADARQIITPTLALHPVSTQSTTIYGLRADDVCVTEFTMEQKEADACRMGRVSFA